MSSPRRLGPITTDGYCTLHPQAVDAFRLAGTEGMGPRLRGDDGEQVASL
jgi:hypothetical protein